MWTALPDMMVPRSSHSLAVVQGRRLVVMAGWGREKTSMKQVERRNREASMNSQAV